VVGRPRLGTVQKEARRAFPGLPRGDRTIFPYFRSLHSFRTSTSHQLHSAFLNFHRSLYEFHRIFSGINVVLLSCSSAVARRLCGDKRRKECSFGNLFLFSTSSVRHFSGHQLPTHVLHVRKKYGIAMPRAAHHIFTHGSVRIDHVSKRDCRLCESRRRRISGCLRSL
jgi:hypothetical protein